MENTYLLVGIAIYFAAMVYIGYRMAARNKGAEDFLVGGRSFGMFFNTGMLLACWMGGAIILGTPGTYMAFGFWDSGANWGMIVGFGGTCCLLVAGLFFMKRLWQLKLLSLGDFFYLRYGRQTGIISTVLMCFTFTIWVAVQVVSFAKVGTTLLGLSLTSCVIISVVVICTYTILGGLYAVCFTDIVQVIIVFIGILVLTPMTVSMAGGAGEVVASVPEQHWNFFPQGAGMHGWLAWVAAWCTIGLGSVCSPDLLQRAFCAKSGNVARNSAVLAWAIMVGLNVIMFLLSYSCVKI
ncbi:MAG: hypothetical protein IJD04_03030, partial [Desulfovibrionaceae bacterium]|nr:hypothetical protein [Desulfovibrionaceae bacterium]